MTKIALKGVNSMDTVLIIAIIAMVVLLYMLLRFLFKRIFLWKAFSKFTRQYHYTYKISFRNLLPGNSTTHLVEIETQHTIYRIKLFGLLRKHCEIHFWDSQNYSIAWYFSRYGYVGTAPIGQTGSRNHRSLGNSDWTTTTNKKVIPILLIDPANAPVRLTQTQTNHLVDLRAGEMIGNILFADRDFLFRFIEKQEKSESL